VIHRTISCMLHSLKNRRFANETLPEYVLGRLHEGGFSGLSLQALAMCHERGQIRHPAALPDSLRPGPGAR